MRHVATTVGKRTTRKRRRNGGGRNRLNPPTLEYNPLRNVRCARNRGSSARRIPSGGNKGALSGDGNILLAAESNRVLREWAESTSVGRDGLQDGMRDGSPVVHCGTAFPADEYVITCLRVGNLTSDCVDFGGNLKLSTAVRSKLRTGEDVETKKRNIHASAAGVEWVSKGQPKRGPDRRRSDILAGGIRLARY